MSDFLKRAGEFFREHGLLVAAAFIGLVALGAFAGGAFGAPAERVAEAPACQSVEVAKKAISERNGVGEPQLALSGKAAADMAAALGASFEVSDLLVYVVGENVYFAAFSGGCFRGIAGPMPLMVFRAMFQGVLPE